MRKLSERLYRMMLRAYPADFRDEYGPEMVRLFRNRSTAEPLLALWLHTLLDWAVTVPSRHLDVLRQDLRYGFRVLFRAPGFTAAAVLSLALGIGGTTAIFSAVYAVVLKPLPYRDPGRLVQVTEAVPRTPYFAVSPACFLDWKAQNQVFADMAAMQNVSTVVAGGDRPERVRTSLVSASFFPLLGVEPMLGRAFRPEEDRPGGESVAVLAHSLWLRHFGADPAVIGRNMIIDDAPFTIIGVMPPSFRYFVSAFEKENTDLWIPYPFRRDPPTEREVHRLAVIARLLPNTSLQQAQADMDRIASGIHLDYRFKNAIRLTPLGDYLVMQDRNSLWTLLAAVGLVLLIACANVANLLLARAAAREREIAVRISIGAGWRRLTRQLLTESVLLALLGCCAGLALAWWAASALPVLSPGPIARIDETRLNLWVLAFAVGASVLCGVLFGLAPARRLLTRDAAARHRNRLGAVLMVSQIALAVVLLTGAGLTLHSLWRLAQVHLGFDPENVLTFRVYLSKERIADRSGRDPQGQQIWSIRPHAVAFFEEIQRRLEALPGVAAAGATNNLPVSRGAWGLRFQVEGGPLLARRDQPSAYHLGVTPSYFSALRIAVIQGRVFTDRDAESAPPVAIINEGLARQYFPNENAVGRRLRLRDGNLGPERWVEIVGVTAGSRHYTVRDEDDKVIYTPFRQRPADWIDWQIGFRQGMSYVVRFQGDPAGLAPAVQQVVRGLDPTVPVESFSTMESLVERSSKPLRSAMWLLGLFAATALVLSAVGIYGVVAYAVERRTREIGIRIALGAQARDVVRMFLRQGLFLTLAGLVLGVAGALAATRVLSSVLYGIKPTDPATFAVVAAFFTAVALAASWLPARRAARVDPMTTLRHE
jgi:putative ABC transport system permease protein